MTRTVRTFEFVAQLVDDDPSQLVLRVHLLEVWRKDDIGARRSGQSYITLEIAWVTVKVFIPIKLERIDKPRQHTRVAVRSGRLNQRQMSLVKEAQGGDESNGPRTDRSRLSE